MNGSGSVDGVLVIPWPVYLTYPVGWTGVPPHVQVAVACADAAPQPPAINDTAPSAATARIARGLICLLSFAPGEGAHGLTSVPGRPDGCSAARPGSPGEGDYCSRYLYKRQVKKLTRVGSRRRAVPPRSTGGRARGRGPDRPPRRRATSR